MLADWGQDVERYVLVEPGDVRGNPGSGGLKEKIQVRGPGAFDGQPAGGGRPAARSAR